MRDHKLKKIAIIQARMSSTRLPGKILKEICGIPMLQIQIERLKRCMLIDQIVIATTESQKDDVVIDLCNKLSISTFRGSESDVLSRYFKTATYYDSDVIIRFTSDCPLIDPKLVDDIIEFYCNHNEHYDYVSNGIIQTYPRGMDTEVFNYSVLKSAFESSKEKYEKEHVTPFIYDPKNGFKMYNFSSTINLNHYRLTVDTIEDFILVDKIFNSLYKKRGYGFTLEDIIEFLNSNPELLSINSSIQQKDMRNL